MVSGGLIKVLIADDHEIVRKGLRLTIQAEDDLELVGEAADGLEAVHLAASAGPDVVLMDIQMPEMDGIQALQEIRRKSGDLPVLMLTSFADDARLYSALRAGASGYLTKDIDGGQLVLAIRGAARGVPQFSAAILTRLMKHMSAPQDPFSELTERERDVLRLIAHGRSNKEIGLDFGLTEVTVKGYVSNILSKLSIQDRTQAALLAVRYGLVGENELPGMIYPHSM